MNQIKCLLVKNDFLIYDLHTHTKKHMIIESSRLFYIALCIQIID